MKLSAIISCQSTVFEAVSFEKNLEKSIKKMKEIGYQGIELAIRNPKDIKIDEIKRIVNDSSMPVIAIGTGQAFLDEGISLSDLNREIRKRAVERFRNQIEFAAEFNAQVIIGLIRGKSKKEKEIYARKNLLESLKICDEFAKKKNVILAIEPLNRYETNLVNNAYQAIQLIKELKGSQFRILLDTFHMNIEEVNLLKSIEISKNYLSHFHVADSNRYAPGKGHINFLSILDCLKKIGYQKFISPEVLSIPDFNEAMKQSYNYIFSLINKNNKK